MSQTKIKEEKVPEFDKSLSVFPELLQSLLLKLGIKTAEEAESFLNPDYDRHTHDPFLMKDMEKAVKRLFQAISGNEKVVIFSDYDADGIPGAVVLHDFFKKIGFENFENYIPHRGNEGFGLNHPAIEEFAKSGAKVLITVDCGIADAEEVAKANKLGLDVIITDHHELNGKFPPAFAVLDPKQKDCAYPDKNLCGAAVAFKLVQALASRIRVDLKIENCKLKIATSPIPEGWEKWLLDMVGLATLSDMVPLTGENRVLAFYGLKVLHKSPRPGLQQLLQKLRIKQRFLNEDDIGFMIAPRINAASRMGIPMDAFKLLSTSDTKEAGAYANHLDKINNERKGLVASMVKEVRKIMSEREKERRVIVIGNPNWKPSLLGLVANALMEEHSKPVFLWGREETSVLKGSCRSDGTVNLVALMESSKGFFLEFGGHRMSGGFSIAQDKVHLLEEELERAYEEICQKGAVETEGEEIGTTAVKLSLDEVSEDTYRIIEKMAPFGMGNPKPVFLFDKAVPVTFRQFGKEKNHLELVFENAAGEKISAIAFFKTTDDFERKIKIGVPLTLVATIEKSYFRPRPEIRLRIVDIS